MLLVKTKIGKSKIEGLGCFANQFIPKGTIVWKFTPNFDIVTPPLEVEKLPEIARKTFCKYAYLNKKTGMYVLCWDDGKFFNHSDKPNVISVDTENDAEGLDVTARDILQGEEITCNYDDFDADMKLKLRELFK